MIREVDSFITKEGINWGRCIGLLKGFNSTVHKHSDHQISKAMKSPYVKQHLKNLIQQLVGLLKNFPPRSPALEEHKE
jgi:hypothetical protein